MEAEKSTKEQEQMEMLKSMLERPCAICDEKPVTVKRFAPVDSVAFGITAEEMIYFAVCRPCWERGIEYEFLEATLLHAGVKYTLD